MDELGGGGRGKLAAVARAVVGGGGEAWGTKAVGRWRPQPIPAATHMHGGYRYRPEPRPAPPLLPRDSCRCCPCG